jgi:uncharacterized protein (DUF1800 family)
MQRETLSAIRFGFGLSPHQNAPAKTADLLSVADRTARIQTRIPLSQRTAQLLVYRESRKQDLDARKAARRKLMKFAMDDVRAHLSFAVSDSGFGARLTGFWGDHFTVAANGALLRMLVPDFLETAIRPNITGYFPDMLRAAATHPAVLIYLNQVQSVGPNSRAGQRRDRGLNENLARELLELHTLGVDADYAQTDVRALAELLTGLSVKESGFVFRPGISEPGPHVILGKSYGERRTTLAHIEEALQDLAMHPATALHLARKLLTHFIGADDEDLVQRMAQAYLASDGALTELYAVMLDAASSWDPTLRKAKPPFDFIASSLRASGAQADEIASIKPGDLRQGIYGAMQLMGQPMFQPPGPDGWSENPSDWITPPGLAARIRWATAFAERIEATHDPRAFLDTALADAASPTLRFAVGGSESRVEGIALTLVSPEFNRR